MTSRPALTTVLVLLGGIHGGRLAAQAMNPPYLAEFPSVERVKQAMKVADPKETAVRQIGALWQLQEIIKALSGRREFRGFLPDEGKVIQNYYAAAYYIGLAIDSAFPGRYKDGTSVSDYTPYRYMRTDPRFGTEGLDLWKLLSPAVQDQYYQVIGVERAKMVARAHDDSMARAAAQARMERPPQQPGSQLGEEQRGIRRCAESGRSETQCMMEGLGKSFMNMVGGAIPILKSEPVYGLRVSGAYPGQGKFRLAFDDDNVTLSCSDLEPASYSYAVTVNGGQVSITILAQPRPLVLAFRADEHLAGPPTADITGQVQVGIQYGTRTWSDGTTQPISRPVYETFTRHCTIGVLATAGPASVSPSGSAAAAGLLGMVFGSIDKNTPPPAAVGLRLVGEYGTQTAFDVEFRPEGAVVGCRDATVIRPYAVQLQGGRVMVNIQHGTTPIALALGDDGRLAGSGTVRVDGRAVVGTSGDGSLTYAPRSASCPVGLLAPIGSPVASTVAGPAPSASPPNPAAPASAAGGAVFQLENGFAAPAGGANPLAGRPFVLLNESLEDILKEAGVTSPAGVSASRTLEQICAARTPQCQTLMQATSAHAVAVLKPDQKGTAQSPELPAGTYYLVGSGAVAGKTLTWNLKVVGSAGWSKVTLTQANASH
ncbi:MAG TPA: hypothetical protein VFU23_08855 [Gemmatimonadales bacterium]|nr:hypothetical protein [Gemmatimonadales bacterium]